MTTCAWRAPETNNPARRIMNLLNIPTKRFFTKVKTLGQKFKAKTP
jgi:hypothetical protein